jgi:predicted ABC-type ATPase
MSKTLWIVAGPNGAGKSSLVARYNKEGLPVSNPDDIAKELRHLSLSPLRRSMF